MSQRKRQRQCLYIENELLEEIREEAFRQDRSLSWIVQRAWRAARDQVCAMPGTNDYLTLANDDADDEHDSAEDGPQSAVNES